MPTTDFPLDLSADAASIRRHEDHGKSQIWCLIRRRWLAFQPEELVRQALIQHLASLGYPTARMQVEQQFGGGATRVDLVVRDAELQPWMLVEVKAPHIDHRAGMAQLADYARFLQVQFCLTLNGSWATCLALEEAAQRWVCIDTLPPYPPAT